MNLNGTDGCKHVNKNIYLSTTETCVNCCSVHSLHFPNMISFMSLEMTKTTGETSLALKTEWGSGNRLN